VIAEMMQEELAAMTIDGIVLVECCTVVALAVTSDGSS
jgi:hypothetical protein